MMIHDDADDGDDDDEEDGSHAGYTVMGIQHARHRSPALSVY